MKFSDRIGVTKPREVYQLDSMGHDLSKRLWIVIVTHVDASYNAVDDRYSTSVKIHINQCKRIWTDVFLLPSEINPLYKTTDSLYYKSTYWKELWLKYNSYTWDQKYNLIELLAKNLPKSESKLFRKQCNKVLKEELSGYLFIKKNLVPITSEIEIKEIKKALNSKWDSVNVHLKSSLELLSAKPNPNYRKAINAAFLALESACKIVCPGKQKTLGDVLKSKAFIINERLRSALKSLYAYSNDPKSAIRHAGTTENLEDVTQEDAKFILITCSAFINYLQVKVVTQEENQTE